MGVPESLLERQKRFSRRATAPIQKTCVHQSLWAFRNLLKQVRRLEPAGSTLRGRKQKLYNLLFYRHPFDYKEIL